ncbi:MAG: aldehyde dehydrogenase family protein [Paracoccaceae bacterium]
MAANYRSTLTRYERSQILKRAGEIIGERRDYLARWLVLELGICWQHAVYETKRAGCLYLRRGTGAAG